MGSILINVIQHEQYYLIILLTDLKAATLLKKSLAQMFFCEFSEISKINFFIEHIQANVFGLSFLDPRKFEGSSLVNFLRSCHLHIT